MRTTTALLSIAITTTALLAPEAHETPARTHEAGVTAEYVLTRWVQAVGGAERLRTIRATYSRARVEGSEGEGRVDEWSTSKGQRHQKSETTIGEDISVFDGRRSWSSVNGRVRALSPDETRGELTAGYFAAGAHLVPGRLPGRCEYLGQVGAQRLHALEITPRGGRPTRYYLDPETFLPVRSEREMVYTTLTIEYHDWRVVEGLHVPGRTILATADSAFMATETLEEIRFNPPLESTLFGRPKEGPSGVRFDSDSHIARIPIDTRVAHIFFRGRLNDSSAVWLSIDTGAYGNVIDDEYARALGVPLLGRQRIFGAAGSTESARVRGLSIGLPGVRLENQSFATTPLQFLSPPTGLDIKGILGYDIFSRFVVEIDYAGKEMRLHDPARYRYRGRGTSIPITLRDNHPYVRAQIRMPDGAMVEGEFTIDAGSGATLMLAPDFAAAHGLPQILERRREGRGAGVGGEMRTQAGRLPGLRLGPYELADPVVYFPTAEITAPGTAGNIGGGLLRRFVVTFDYRRMRMILEPNAAFTEKEEADMSGLALSAAGPEWSMVSIDRARPDSPGDEAGVKPGDVLEFIDDRPASALGVDSLRTLFRRESSYDLVVRRDDRRMPVTIRTRRHL